MTQGEKVKAFFGEAFMHYLAAFMNYAVFKGRTNRREFWMFALIHMSIQCFLYFAVLMSVPVLKDTSFDSVYGNQFQSAYGRYDYGDQQAYVQIHNQNELKKYRNSLLLWGVYSLVLCIPTLAIGCRRLHDTGKSGWLQLASLVPIVGPIVLIVLWTQESQVQDNPYN